MSVCMAESTYGIRRSGDDTIGLGPDTLRAPTVKVPGEMAEEGDDEDGRPTAVSIRILSPAPEPEPPMGPD